MGFDVEIQGAGLFIHSSHGTAAELGLSGRNGPSIFPTTSLAARLQIRSDKKFFARFVVADGVPGDPDDPGGTEIRFDSGDGVFIAGEIGFYNFPSPKLSARTRHSAEASPEQAPPDRRAGKIAIGAWGYTGDFDESFGLAGAAGPTRSGSYGVYLLAEQRIYFEREDPNQDLSIYARLGIADPKTTMADG